MHISAIYLFFGSCGGLAFTEYLKSIFSLDYGEDWISLYLGFLFFSFLFYSIVLALNRSTISNPPSILWSYDKRWVYQKCGEMH